MEINLKCSVEKCRNQNHINGICLHHYGFINYNQFMKSWGNATSSDGYLQGRHKGKLMKTHRVVMEAFIGREIRDDEDVHHINHNKKDNRIENLQLMSKRDHQLLHALEFTKVKPSDTHKECLECKQLKPLNKFKIKEYYSSTGLPKRIGKCNQCKPPTWKMKIINRDKLTIV